MAHRIKEIKTGNNLCLIATFLDGTIKEYNIGNLFAKYPQLKDLENKELFDSVQVDVGGCGVSWNDDLDLDSETIWEDGVFAGKDTVDVFSELAAKVAETRAKVGITQKQLAEKTGIYQADISKIERGLSNPSVSTLQRLADGMGMNLLIDFQNK